MNIKDGAYFQWNLEDDRESFIKLYEIDEETALKRLKEFRKSRGRSGLSSS